MSLTARMDETRIEDRIDDTYQEDGEADDIALLSAQYTILRTLHSLSSFSDESARVGDVPSSPTRSPMHLSSLSSDPLGSPYTDGNPNTTTTGLGISSVSSSSLCDLTRDELFREIRQELFADMRSELLRSKLETAVVQQENTALRQRIEELESASVHAPGSHTFTPTSPSVSVFVSGSHTSTPASPANTPLDQPVEYLVSHLIDPVISFTHLGDFTTDEERWVFFRSNNDLDTAVEILLSCPPVPSARIRFDESQYRPPRGRGRGGHTPQLFGSSFSANPVLLQQSVPLTPGSSVRDEQVTSTFGRLKDIIGNLGTLITDNMSHNARSTRDSKQRLMSGHKFDTSKIRQYTGDCTLGAPDQYWLRPDSWTKHFKNLMLSCTISHDHWTHVVLMCCGPTVDVPYARRQTWPKFVK